MITCMRQIILASQSPRRREILKLMGLIDFEVVPSDFDEYLDDNQAPEAVAELLGLGKALSVAQDYPEAIVIGSDTIVTISDKQLAKADSLEHAQQMLRVTAKAPNKITSSLAVICLAEDLKIVTHENAWVYFKPYDEVAVNEYLQTGDYKDKAGAYGVQSGAAPLIEQVKGNFDCVVGLPSHALTPILQNLGLSEVEAIDYPCPVPISAA